MPGSCGCLEKDPWDGGGGFRELAPTLRWGVLWSRRLACAPSSHARGSSGGSVSTAGHPWAPKDPRGVPLSSDSPSPWARAGMREVYCARAPSSTTAPPLARLGQLRPALWGGAKRGFRRKSGFQRETRPSRSGLGDAAPSSSARSLPCLPRPSLGFRAQPLHSPDITPHPDAGFRALPSLKPGKEPVPRPCPVRPRRFSPAFPASSAAPSCQTAVHPPRPHPPAMAQKPKVDPHVGRLGYLQALVTEFQETESQGESDRVGVRGTGRGCARDPRPGLGSRAAFPLQTPRSKSWPTSPTSPMTPAITSIYDSCRSWIYSSIRCRRRMRPWWNLLLVSKDRAASRMPYGLRCVKRV